MLFITDAFAKVTITSLLSILLYNNGKVVAFMISSPQSRIVPQANQVRTMTQNNFERDVLEDDASCTRHSYQRALQEAAKDQKSFEEFVSLNPSFEAFVSRNLPKQSENQPTEKEKIGYVPIEEWDDALSKEEISWEEKVQFDGQRYGNKFRQNDILRKNL